MKSALELAKVPFTDRSIGWQADATAMLKEQAAEIDALRKDAERYRFLRGDFSPMGLDANGQHAWAYRRNATLNGPTLDAAIDKEIGQP